MRTRAEEAVNSNRYGPSTDNLLVWTASNECFLGYRKYSSIRWVGVWRTGHVA